MLKFLLCLWVGLALLYSSSIWAQVPTSIQLSNNQLPENEELYTYIGLLSATDPDQATGHQFDLTTCADASRFFRVRNDSLFSFFSFNYERQARYTIELKATDANNLVYLQNLATYAHFT